MTTRQTYSKTDEHNQQLSAAFTELSAWHLLARNATALHDPEIGELGQALHLPLSIFPPRFLLRSWTACESPDASIVPPVPRRSTRVPVDSQGIIGHKWHLI